MRVLGLDPGLRHTGWGVIDVTGNRLTHVADGNVNSTAKAPLHERLAELHDGLAKIIDRLAPDEAAVEETFVNQGARSALLLGQARGVVLMTPASMGVPVAEYAANLIKKSVVGAGHADKEQVQAMIKILLPQADVTGADVADALAIAICHAHHREMAQRLQAAR